MVRRKKIVNSLTPPPPPQREVNLGKKGKIDVFLKKSSSLPGAWFRQTKFIEMMIKEESIKIVIS